MGRQPMQQLQKVLHVTPWQLGLPVVSSGDRIGQTAHAATSKVLHVTPWQLGLPVVSSGDLHGLVMG